MLLLRRPSLRQAIRSPLSADSTPAYHSLSGARFSLSPRQRNLIRLNATPWLMNLDWIDAQVVLSTAPIISRDSLAKLIHRAPSRTDGVHCSRQGNYAGMNPA